MAIEEDCHHGGRRGDCGRHDMLDGDAAQLAGIVVT
jgi:hypothetical protein